MFILCLLEEEQFPLMLYCIETFFWVSIINVYVILCVKINIMELFQSLQFRGRFYKTGIIGNNIYFPQYYFVNLFSRPVKSFMSDIQFVCTQWRDSNIDQNKFGFGLNS